ncbi:uncharacterized protein LOC128546956 [Mercenaria mercenaria]|uniref:uncharacterized protein LOC128546956 n=1 Tax=Mercenaria mercenaria TaxID=6596 RepID=UPI00234E8A1F|nr:uncharacterized protein LOC128546956 [Mercenaria mercenaria]
MARWGISEKVISDNGPCYSSQEFVNFARKWDIKHETCSPYHSQSNGLAEKYVSICKRILTKAKASKGDPLIGILQYRTTPLESGLSPAQLLMGKQLRSVLPTSRDNLTPKILSPNLVKETTKISKGKWKSFYDGQTKSLELLSIGQTARIQQLNKTWQPAVVTERHNDRSYSVCTPDGAIYRRNRRNLLKTNEPSPETGALDPEIQTPSYTEETPLMSEIKEASDSQVPASTDSNRCVTRSGKTVIPTIIESM